MGTIGGLYRRSECSYEDSITLLLSHQQPFIVEFIQLVGARLHISMCGQQAVHVKDPSQPS